MIKAIIFDLNGIFIQSPNLSTRFQEKFGVPLEEFLPALKEIMAKVKNRNAENSFNYWRPYLEKWGLNLTEEEFFSFWFGAEKENLEVIEIVRQIKKKGIKIFILSNNLKEKSNYYQDSFQFLKEIPDKIYYSWQTGFIKPNPEAFKNVLSENNLEPEECLYFDDQEKNIEAANSLGMNAFLFKNTEDLKRTLVEYQLINTSV